MDPMYPPEQPTSRIAMTPTAYRYLIPNNTLDPTEPPDEVYQTLCMWFSRNRERIQIALNNLPPGTPNAPLFRNLNTQKIARTVGGLSRRTTSYHTALYIKHLINTAEREENYRAQIRSLIPEIRLNPTPENILQLRELQNEIREEYYEQLPKFLEPNNRAVHGYPGTSGLLYQDLRKLCTKKPDVVINAFEHAVEAARATSDIVHCVRLFVPFTAYATERQIRAGVAVLIDKAIAIQPKAHTRKTRRQQQTSVETDTTGVILTTFEAAINWHLTTQMRHRLPPQRILENVFKITLPYPDAPVPTEVWNYEMQGLRFRDFLVALYEIDVTARARARILCVAMGLHPRLGRTSILMWIDDSVLRTIVAHL